MNKDIPSYIRLFIIIFFIVMISIPGAITVFDSKNKFIMPVDSSKKFTVEFENYFNENFGARKEFITGFYFARMKLLHETYIDDKIVSGKDGWLFYGPKTDGLGFEDAAGKLYYQPSELEKIKNNLEEQYNWLERKNIKFLLVICPNKQTIYPEKLPASFTRGTTSLDQLVQYLTLQSRIPFIDLRESMSKAKTNYSMPLYFKTDTHWNDLGAFIAYQEIARKISDGRETGKSIPFTDYDIKAYTSKGQDITAMVGLENYYTDTEIKFSSRHIRNKISSKKVLLFHDSYFNRMRPYFQIQFDTVMERPHFWNSFDYQCIEETKPDLVVYELLERYQRQLLRNNPDEIKK